MHLIFRLFQLILLNDYVIWHIFILIWHPIMLTILQLVCQQIKFQYKMLTFPLLPGQHFRLFTILLTFPLPQCQYFRLYIILLTFPLPQCQHFRLFTILLTFPLPQSQHSHPPSNFADQPDIYHPSNSSNPSNSGNPNTLNQHSLLRRWRRLPWNGFIDTSLSELYNLMWI